MKNNQIERNNYLSRYRFGNAQILDLEIAVVKIAILPESGKERTTTIFPGGKKLSAIT